MDNNFDFVSNLPLMVLGFLFLVVFIFFIWGGITLLRAEGDPERIQKGRERLLTAFYGFLVVLIIVGVFYAVSYFLKKGKSLQPKQTIGEFPASPAENFPEPTQSIKIGQYYFNGPFAIKKNNKINKLSVYAVLCKKDDKYDIMSIEESERDNLLKNKQYSCWMENCGKNLNNIYTALLIRNKEIYDLPAVNDTAIELKKEINLPCSSAD